MEQNKCHIAGQKNTGNVCFHVCTTNNSEEQIQNMFFGFFFFLKQTACASEGFDPSRNQVYSEASPSVSEEWLLLVDQADLSHRRAIIIKNKCSGSYLAVQNGHFTGQASYNEDCKWFLE